MVQVVGVFLLEFSLILHASVVHKEQCRKEGGRGRGGGVEMSLLL